MSRAESHDVGGDGKVGISFGLNSGDEAAQEKGGGVGWLAGLSLSVISEQIGRAHV